MFHLSIIRPFGRRLATTPPQIPIRKLPHLIEPKTLIGASALTASYFLYLWFTDDGKAPSDYLKGFEATIYKRLPSNAYSLYVGKVSGLTIPEFMRGIIYGTYARLARCNMAEAKETDFKKYETFGQFFARELAPDSRPVDRTALINAPSDGIVVSVGIVDDEKRLLEQVKGSTFKMDEFLGPTDTFRRNPRDTELHQCVIYLCPGDYHRFHSPVKWTVKLRRHFPGKLLSVQPTFTAKLPGLFTLNERVSYLGQWRHGFMSMTAVGAAGVGSVVVPRIDPTLSTNQKRGSGGCLGMVADDLILVGAGVENTAGEPFGYFQMGSTIVLVFEVPKGGASRWLVRAGDKIRVGQALMR